VVKALSSLDILLVDDNPGDRALVRHMLPRETTLRQVSSAEEARQALEEGVPDIVLLDYWLPDAKGTALLPLFAPQQVPVVMLTGMEAAEVVVEAIQAGAHDYVVKNQLSPEGLEHVITNALEKARLRRAVEEQQEKLARQAAVLEAKNRAISDLAGALTLAEQEERRRVATLLHDHVQQLLFGVRLGLAGIADAENSDERRQRVDRIDNVLGEAIEATRSLAVDLTPPVMDYEELDVGLRWIAEHMHARYGLEVTVDAATPCRIASRELRVLLLQLVRELLFNVVKHAGVQRATLRLHECSRRYSISVIDEGRGFDPELLASMGYGAEGLEMKRAFGLYSVRERLELLGGRLEITSRPGCGSRLTIHAPVSLGQQVPPEEPDLFSQPKMAN
jgi:signal transduction histidine kinase